jgi:type IV secretory pathway VirB10-like protein
MKRIAVSRVIATAVLALAQPAGAELYKWIDADGKVHYSDQPPPPGAKQQKAPGAPRTAAPAPAPPGDGKTAAAAPTAPKTPAEQEMEFRKRRVEQAEAEAKRQQEAQAAAEKQRNCQQAMNRVAMLQTGGRITKAGPNGEQIYLGDSEIAAELVEARKVADSWCK